MVCVCHDQDLEEMSWMVVNGKMIKKLDLIGIIHIYDEEYFTVYRRYNNVYEIVIKDYNNDIYVRKDEPIYKSLQNILCLSDDQMENIYTMNAISFKHNSLLPSSMNHLEEMYWSDIQSEWYGLSMNVGGILEEYYNQKKRRKSEKEVTSKSDDDTDNDTDNDDKGDLKEMNEVEEDSNLPIDLTTTPNSPTNTTTSTIFSTPTQSLKTPITPYTPKKLYTYSSRVSNNNESDASSILSFLKGESLSNEVVYPKKKDEVETVTNKRKWLEESNDSDFVKKEVTENDDEDSSSEQPKQKLKPKKLKNNLLMLCNHTKCRKLEH